MAGFGEGLVSGFQVGNNARMGWDENDRLKEKQKWATEDRGRQKKELDALAAIRKAGALSFDDVSMDQPSPDVAMPSMRAAQPASAQVDAPVITPVAAPGQGVPAGLRAAVSTESTGLQSNVAPERAPNMAAPQVGFSEPAAPQQMQAAQGMQKAKTFSDMDKMNRSFVAMTREAMKQGRPDIALQYQVEGLKIRDGARSKAAEAARANYDTTGNIAAFIPYVNNYVSTGAKIDSIEKNDKGYIIKGTTDDGKSFGQARTPEQMQRYIEFATDPASAKALDAKQAEEFYKTQLKIQEQSAKNMEPKVVGPNAMIWDPRTGGTFTNERDGEGLKSLTLKDGETGYIYDNKGVRGTVGGGSAPGMNVPKEVSDRQKDVSSFVFKLNGVNDMASMDPKQTQSVRDQSNLASDLFSANHGTDAWSALSPAKAADIAHKIFVGDPGPDGKPVRLPIMEFPIKGSDQKIRGVEFEGVKYLLDPNAAKMMSAPAEFKDAVKSSGISPELAPVAMAFYGQESSYGKADTSKPNYANVRGPMQVQKDTFDGMKAEGRIPKNFDWANPRHTMIAGLRHIEDLARMYKGNVAKMAAAYYSGPKAVTPDGRIRDLRDPENPKAPSTLQYVAQVTGRINQG